MAVDDQYTKALLHFDGTPTTQVFDDGAGNTWSLAGSGTANTYLSDTVAKFGPTSLRAGYNPYLSLSGGMSSGMNPADGDFTYDFWVYLSGGETKQINLIQAQRAYQVDSYVFYLAVGESGDNIIRLGFTGYAGSEYLGNNWSSYISANYNTWHHIEVCRSGDDYLFFLNGVKQFEVNSDPHTYNLTGSYLYIFRGYEIYYDEFRYSVGVARHTSNFTPPTEPYPDAYPLGIDSDIDLSEVLGVSGTIQEGYDGDIRSSFEIELDVSGTIDADQPVIDATLTIPFDLSGEVVQTNVLEADIAIPFLVGAEVEFYGMVYGEFAQPLPMFEIEGEATTSTIGTVSRQLPALTIEAIASAGIYGSADTSLPKLRISATADADILATAELTLPKLQLTTGSGQDGSVGASLVLPFYRISAEGHASVLGTAELTLPPLTVRASIEPFDHTALVLNLKNFALTEFDNYNFNSMCYFNGVNLGASSTGIYNLDDGTTDDGVDVDWNFKIGYLDLHFKAKKKLRQAWIACKNDGNLIVTVSLADGTEYEYTAKSYEETEDGVRIKFGRGIRDRYIAMDVRNDEAGSITLDSIRLALDSYKKVR